MVKVIGFDKTFEKRVSCENCAAIIEYVDNDTYSYIHRDYGGGSDKVTYLKCPNCGSQVTIKVE